jgi:hypothetical protein
MSVDDLWPEIREAFAFYGRKLGATCGPSRRKLIEQRLSEGYEPSDLVCAVHGYVHFHEGLEPEEGSTFNPRKWFDPDSVFKATRFDTRVEMGYEGVWEKVDPKERREAAVKARQEAANEKVAAARRERDQSRLRAV